MQKQLHGGDFYRNHVEYDFSANINPLGTPEGVIQAMQESLMQIKHYPDVHCTKLMEALSSYEGLDKEMLLCGNGAADLIFSVVQSVKPKKALVQSPTFMEYELALKNTDCDITYFATSKENGYVITEEILEHITEELDMMFLCNPNNPTGVLIQNELLEKIVTRCEEKKVLFVLDECFQDFVAEEEMYTMKHRLNGNSYLFILRAFTKKYAMAGIRLGYGMCGNKELLTCMKEGTQPWNVSIVAQAAGVAALKEVEYVNISMKLVAEQRTYLKEELKKLGFVVYDSKANYIFFEGSASLYEDCLQKGVLIRDCSNYVGLHPGNYRIAVKSKTENETLIATLREIR